jgi:hypothetical protein
MFALWKQARRTMSDAGVTMALFQKADPRAKLESQLQAKRAQLETNAKRLQDAEAKLAECRRKVEEFALGDDSKALDGALQSRRAAEDLVGALSSASNKIGQEISSIEAQIAAEIDKLMRSETASAVEALARQVAAAAIAFDVAVGDLQAAVRECQPVTIEANGLALFATNVRTETPPAIAVLLDTLRQYRDGVLDGRQRPSLPKSEAPAPKLAIVPPPPTLTLLSMRKLKYVNADGGVTVLGAYHKHDFPKALGELAIKTNVAIHLNDKRRADVEMLASVGTPDESSCEWLGPPGREAPQRFMRPGGTPTMHSLSPTPFTPMDRGPGFTVRVPRGPGAGGDAACGRRAQVRRG